MLLFTAANEQYMQYVEYLIASASVHMPRANWHVFCINVSKSKENTLTHRFPFVHVTHIKKEFETIAHERAFCANLRIQAFPKLMEQYHMPIAWVDADSLFVSNAEALVDHAHAYDVSVEWNDQHRTLHAGFFRKLFFPKGPLGTPYYGVASTGVLTTNNSQVAKKFFITYEQKAKEHMEEWYTDQEALFLTVQDMQDEVKFSSLPHEFCDRKRTETTVIWTAKGDTKDSIKYITEARIYMDKIRSQ